VIVGVMMSTTAGRRDFRARALLAAGALRGFQIAAYAEGGLLPAILLLAVVHWLSGDGATAVAVVGTAHGTAFTAYLLLVPCVARLLHWPSRTTSVAISVAFVPFAPWSFERHMRADIDDRIQRWGPPPDVERATRPG
jgi:integral membrane protein